MEIINGEFTFTNEEILLDELEVNTKKLGKLLMLITKDFSLVNKLLSRNTEVIALLAESDEFDEEDRIYISKLIGQNIAISKNIRKIAKVYSNGVVIRTDEKPVKRKYNKKKQVGSE